MTILLLYNRIDFSLIQNYPIVVGFVLWSAYFSAKCIQYNTGRMI